MTKLLIVYLALILTGCCSTPSVPVTGLVRPDPETLLPMPQAPAPISAKCGDVVAAYSDLLTTYGEQASLKRTLLGWYERVYP